MAKKKSEKDKKGKHGILKPFLIVLVILMLLLLAANAFAGTTVSGIGNAITGYIGKLGSGNGYPYDISSELTKNVYSSDSNIILLTDVYARVLSPGAKTKLNVQHNYSAPVVDANGSRFITYDRDSKHYRVVNGKNISSEMEAEGNILTCDMAGNGSFALASRSTQTASTFTVFDKKFNEVFKWNSSSNHIIDLALTDNGKYVAVAALGAEKGEVYSKVLIFNVKSSEALGEFKFSGTAVADIHFTSRGYLYITGDNMFTIIDKNKSEIKSQENFESGSLKFVSVGDNGETAVSFSKFGSSTTGIVKYYSYNGEAAFELNTQSSIYGIAAGKNKFAVYYGDEIIVYNSKGEEKDKIKCTADYDKIFYAGSELYLCRTGRIDTFSSLKDSSDS